MRVGQSAAKISVRRGTAGLPPGHPPPQPAPKSALLSMMESRDPETARWPQEPAVGRPASDHSRRCQSVHFPQPVPGVALRREIGQALSSVSQAALGQRGPGSRQPASVTSGLPEATSHARLAEEMGRYRLPKRGAAIIDSCGHQGGEDGPPLIGRNAH